MGLIPRSGRSPGEGNGNSFQYSYLENPKDRGAWWATVHRVTKSQIGLKWLGMHACKLIRTQWDLLYFSSFKISLFMWNVANRFPKYPPGMEQLAQNPNNSISTFVSISGWNQKCSQLIFLVKDRLKICLWFLPVLLLGYGRRQWHPTPIVLPGKSHGRRSLVGCSPWGRWGLDSTERLHFLFSLPCTGQGNGKPTLVGFFAWRIPGTGEPGGLPSMGSHRIGHDWSDLAWLSLLGYGLPWWLSQ